MSVEHTQRQSLEDRERAKELSLVRTHPPAEAPGYEIHRFLGTGAYGEVWIGVDHNTGRRVAIKFFTHRSGVDWPLLAREVEKLVYMSADRYVVQLLDVGWDADPPYYVMEYIANGSLDDWLKEVGKLTVDDALSLFEELTVGLLRAHGKGILHCDLKPANILLDADRKPILADFGQSRLTGEQRPALGTFFYMAPEQAHAEAFPDAQWDVYALGALLHCMLTGQPPYRDEAALQALESAPTLSERLARYRRLIRGTPFPTAHRRVPGIDRTLIEIIDRCLAIDPTDRFPNVQTVWEALQARKMARSRLPLRLLGLVGPVLILLIAFLFGLRGYQVALRDSENFIRQRAGESNEFAAKFAARSIEAEISRYFRVVNRESEREDLIARVRETIEVPELRRLPAVAENDEENDAVRREFLDNAVRLKLHAYLQERLDVSRERLNEDRNEPKFASIFVVDTQGTMLAVAYRDEFETRSVGRNFSFRTYFHGGTADYPIHIRSPHAKPIEQTHLSAVFRSTTSDSWKVAISTPIYDESGEESVMIGVMAFTVDLGDFAFFRTNKTLDRFVVLIDGRMGPNRGTILQHPRFDEDARNGLRQLADYSSDEFRVPEAALQKVMQRGHFLYFDPLTKAPGGEEFAGVWIASGERVRLPDAPAGAGDMLVLVQENYDAAAAPVQQLGRRLVREAGLALAGVVGVMVGLWYVVLRMLDRPRRLRVTWRAESQLPGAAASANTGRTPAPVVTTGESDHG